MFHLSELLSGVALIAFDPIRRVLNDVRRWKALAQKIGKVASANYIRMERKRALGSREILSIHPCTTAYPIWARLHSSDLRVFSQIFIDLEYDCLNVSDGALLLR